MEKHLQKLLLIVPMILIFAIIAPFTSNESIAANVLNNGGFETGTFSGWVTGNRYNAVAKEGHSVDGINTLLTSPVEGSWFARLGRWDASYRGYAPYLEPSGYDWMYQDVTIPEGSPTLSFSYNIITYDTAAWDWLDVFIKDPANDAILATVVARDGKPGYEYGPYYNCGWKNVNYDMDAFVNRTVRIWFGVRQDNYGDQTAAWIDNVVLSGGSFGQFDPKVDGFGFSNYGDDLSGWKDNDRWDAFKYAFGDEYCEFANGQHKTSAQTFFDDNKKDTLAGHCFGFSASSLKFFGGDWNVADSSFVGYPAGNVVDIRMSTNSGTNKKLAKLIEAEQWSQYGYNTYYFNNPKGICEWLTDNFEKGNPDPAEIAIEDQSPECTGIFWVLGHWVCKPAGHSLVPFKTEQSSDSCKIYVYDSNSPKDEGRYINIDLQNNTWSYVLEKYNWLGSETWSGSASDTQFSIAIHKYSDLKNRPSVPFAPNEGDFEFIVFTSAIAGTIQDALSRRIGFVNGDFKNEMPGAGLVFISTDTGQSGAFVQNYYLPVANQYTMNMTGVTSGAYASTHYGPRGFFRIETTAVPGSVDTATFDVQGRSGIFKTNNSNKQVLVNLVTGVPNLTSERVAELHTNSTPGLGISVGMSNDLNAFTVKMDGLSTPTKYDLRILQQGLGTGEAFYSNIPIQPNDKQILTPNDWSNLAHTTLNLQIDHSGNGTIDEAWILQRSLYRLYSSGAYFMINGYRASTSVDVSDSMTNPSGSLKFNYRTSLMTCYLNSTSIDQISMRSNNTMTVRGTGTVNNQPGYTFAVTAIDNGTPGTGLDQFGIEIKDPSGNIFFSTPNTIISGGDLIISKIN